MNTGRIGVATASHRTIRGYTMLAAVSDEIAFWRSDDSASPDVEILNALRPAMASVEGSVLLALSSPYRRGGVLWKQHTRHFGKDGDPVLCWQAPTRTMNPALPQDVIDDAYAEEARDVGRLRLRGKRRRDGLSPVHAIHFNPQQIPTGCSATTR